MLLLKKFDKQNCDRKQKYDIQSSAGTLHQQDSGSMKQYPQNQLTKDSEKLNITESFEKLASPTLG
jgi:hypothetical protein